MKSRRIELVVDNTVWMFADEIADTHSYEEYLPSAKEVIQTVSNYYQVPVIQFLNSVDCESNEYFVVLVRLLYDRALCDTHTISELLHQNIDTVERLYESSTKRFQKDAAIANQFILLYLKLGRKSSISRTVSYVV